MFDFKEINETVNMIERQHLDIRTITMGISLFDCAREDINAACGAIYDKICRRAEKLVATGESISEKYGIPIVNKRISVTPIAWWPRPADKMIIRPLPLLWIKRPRPAE